MIKMKGLTAIALGALLLAPFVAPALVSAAPSTQTQTLAVSGSPDPNSSPLLVSPQVLSAGSGSVTATMSQGAGGQWLGSSQSTPGEPPSTGYGFAWDGTTLGISSGPVTVSGGVYSYLYTPSVGGALLPGGAWGMAMSAPNGTWTFGTFVVPYYSNAVVSAADPVPSAGSTDTITASLQTTDPYATPVSATIQVPWFLATSTMTPEPNGTFSFPLAIPTNFSGNASIQVMVNYSTLNANAGPANSGSGTGWQETISSTQSNAMGTTILTVTPPPLTVTPTTLPSGTVGTPYSQTLAATGGTPPYTWSLAQGSSLPTGLSLSSSGIISGTPTTAGTSTFAVSATDSGTPVQTAAQQLSLTVNAQVGSTSLTIATTGLPDGVAGTPYAANLAAFGGTAPYTWSITSGTLPAGLSLDSQTGDITGTPTTANTSTLTVNVSGSASPAQTTSEPMSLTINAAAVITKTVTQTIIEQVPVYITRVAQPTAPKNLTLAGGSGVSATSTPASVGAPVGSGLAIYSHVYKFSAALANGDLSFRYDPAVFFPNGPTGMSPLRLGIYTYKNNVWSYIGGIVDTKNDTINLPGVDISQYPAGTAFAVLANTRRFPDMGTAAVPTWFTSSAEAALGHHVVKGLPNNTFAPSAPVTRAQFAAMLVRALRLSTPASGGPTFSDVTSGTWYYGSVETAASADLLHGYPNGTFEPNASITRQEAVVMVNATLAYAENHTGPWSSPAAPTGSAPAYADQVAIPSWATTAVVNLESRGLVQGFPDGSFRPTESVTRAQAVVLVTRLLKILAL